MKGKRTRKIGINLCWLSIALWLLLASFFYLILNENFVQRDIQKSVLKRDKEMRMLIDKGLNHEELEKMKTGLTVFMNDTLVFWNRNDINPKLMKRKVRIGHDTICLLPSGDFYVKSYERGNMTYFVYQLVNTNYQIENHYFENRFQTLPRFIDAKVSFSNTDNGTALLNNDGKVLAFYQFADQPKLKEPYRYLWHLPFIVLLVIGLYTAYGKRREATPGKNKSRVIEIGLAIIILVSIIGTYIYYRISESRENEQMKRQAQNLMEKRDESFETSYAHFAEQLKGDTNIREMVFAESNVLSEVILGYSKDLLFDEKMQSYISSLTLCAPEEEISIQPEGYVTNCDDYFLEKLANNKQKRVGDGLYFMDYYTLDPNYLGKIKIVSKDSLQQKNLYFEFYKPIAPEGFGFPQLLQESNSQKPYDYSVANYRDNLLVYKYGRYVYPNFLNSLKLKDHDFAYSRHYKHYAIIDGEFNAIVISTPTKAFSEITAPFALFFLGLTLPFLLIVWLIRPKEHTKWRDRSLRRRLQNVIFSTLGISLLAVGPVSVFYMQTLYNQKTAASQFETTRTLSIEMRNDLDFTTLMRTASKDTWTEILQHYATTFFTDLNLYQLNGQLLATTRPEIYDLNLQAPLMNAEAYQQMHRNKALFFTHVEHLGKGKYESSYIPIADESGNTLAYLNTPYFSSATDLQKEIKDFVLTYINIILVLLGIALIFILQLTKRLTEPLALIQNKLGDIKIDQKNEPIEWKRDDEIGALVKQYNQLIVELEKSAAELKRTTTETAWRGVARQVAHEIKNSLTPMRLSVQLLQRNIENGKATPEQVQRTTNTLIEQIDALSDIASSFSRYAKLPENHPQPLDLAELIGNVVNLYNNAENIRFDFKYDPSLNYTYNGDKTNLNSVFGNLIKNAVQAIGSKPNGKIGVTLQSIETSFVISVKDNGKGIKDEDKERIFLPNFTTKSGGSGVGLSLSYNIVQAAGGTISFNSQEGEGAEFVIELPK
jgi:signal transduction histidine kinase